MAQTLWIPEVLAFVVTIWRELLHCRNGPGCCSSWGVSSLRTVPDGIFFPLTYLTIFSFLFLYPSQIFRPYYPVTNERVSRSVRHLRFLGKLFSGVSSKFLCNSMGNSYCKKDNSKGEVNAFEVTPIRLQKM